MKRFLLLCVSLFVLVLTTGKSQIIADATVNRFAGPFLQKELMEVKMVFRNVPKDLIKIPASINYCMYNLRSVGSQNWTKVNDTTFEFTMMVEFNNNFYGNYAYIFVYGIGDRYEPIPNPKNVNQTMVLLTNNDITNTAKK